MRGEPKILHVTWLFLLALTAVAAHGQEVMQLGLQVDNDLFVIFDPHDRTDHEYTHGSRIWVESRALDLLPRLLPGLISCDAAVVCRHRVSIGQQIYTPRREGALPIEGQRPHAGWLYVSMETRRTGEREFATFGLQLGVVGPPSLAEEVQTVIHQWFSFREPRGWEHQLPFAPTVQLRLARHARVFAIPVGAIELNGGYGFGADIGNALTRGVAGIEGQACLGPIACSLVRDNRESGYGIAVRGLVGGRAVVRNIFLDGTFRESHSVRKEVWVPAAVVSMSFHLEHIVAEYEVTWRGREYRTEPGGFSFGAIRLVYAW